MAAKNGGQKAGRQDPPKQRPVFEARMGRLKAACWQQESDQGPWFSVTLSRSYKDGQRSWQTAHSFGRDDLLVLAKLCDQVHTWIY
jgi:hypothetical protein